MEWEIRLELTDKILFEENKEFTINAIDKSLSLDVASIKRLIEEKRYNEVRKMPGLIRYLTDYYLSIFQKNFRKILESFNEADLLSEETLRWWEDDIRVSDILLEQGKSRQERNIVKTKKMSAITKLWHDQIEPFYEIFKDLLVKKDYWNDEQSLWKNLQMYWIMNNIDPYPFYGLESILWYWVILGEKNIKRFLKLGNHLWVEKEVMIGFIQNLIDNYFNVYKDLILEISWKVSDLYIKRYISNILKLKDKDYSTYWLDTNFHFTDEIQIIKDNVLWQ